ncbi:MAG TPA: glycosyltransferase [Candidatus Cloacimonadota bacterium]|nr:glycosyltransferase [Candidatus Cloacimonadota bacterium]
MRIAFLGPAYPNRGGIAQFIASWADHFMKAGHEVKVFSFIHQYPDWLFPGKDQNDHSEVVIQLPIQPVLTPYNPFTFDKTVDAILQYQPDILILKYWIAFFAPAFGIILRKLKKKAKFKILYNIDNIDFHEKWMFADSLTRFALSPADYYMTMSNTVYKSLKRILPNVPDERIIQSFHPTYEFYQRQSRLSPDKPEGEPPRILFFGFIKHYKGLDVLLKAMPAILKQIPGLQLLVVGEVYGNDDRYKNLIQSLDIGKHVEFHAEYVPNEEVEKYFTNTDVCVLPYRTATQSGITQLAFAFHTPVIATRVGGLTEVIEEGKNGFLVEPENPSQLADAVVRYFREDCRPRFVKYIAESQRKYSWEPLVEAIERIV